MAWKAAINLSQLQQNDRETVVVDGQKILLIWHDGQVHAVQSQCPHLKLPLAKGKITEDCALVCPFHKSAFDLKTGAVKCWSTWPPAVGALLGKISKPKNLRIYPTRVDKGQIFVELEMDTVVQ
jgi:nitrite reductase/ring-hydroxylating ferredoxin subunit